MSNALSIKSARLKARAISLSQSCLSRMEFEGNHPQALDLKKT